MNSCILRVCILGKSQMAESSSDFTDEWRSGLRDDGVRVSRSTPAREVHFAY